MYVNYFVFCRLKDSVGFYFQDFVGRVRSEGGESAPGSPRWVWLIFGGVANPSAFA